MVIKRYPVKSAPIAWHACVRTRPLAAHSWAAQAGLRPSRAEHAGCVCARACACACPVLCGPKCVRVTTIYGFNTFLEPKVIIIRPHAYASRMRLVRFALAYMRSVLRWCLNAKYVPNTPTCAHKQLPIHLYERARARVHSFPN